MKDKVFVSGCKSWYQGKNGEQWLLYPSSLIQFMIDLWRCDPQDYIYRK